MTQHTTPRSNPSQTLKRRPPQTYTTKRAEAQRLAWQGLGPKAIATRLGVSRSTITNWAREDGFRAADLAARVRSGEAVPTLGDPAPATDLTAAIEAREAALRREAEAHLLNGHADAAEQARREHGRLQKLAAFAGGDGAEPSAQAGAGAPDLAPGRNPRWPTVAAALAQERFLLADFKWWNVAKIINIVRAAKGLAPADPEEIEATVGEVVCTRFEETVRTCIAEVEALDDRVAAARLTLRLTQLETSEARIAQLEAGTYLDPADHYDEGDGSDEDELLERYGLEVPDVEDWLG